MYDFRLWTNEDLLEALGDKTEKSFIRKDAIKECILRDIPLPYCVIANLSHYNISMQQSIISTAKYYNKSVQSSISDSKNIFFNRLMGMIMMYEDVSGQTVEYQLVLDGLISQISFGRDVHKLLREE